MLFRSNDTATTEIYTSSYTLSLHDALPIAGVVADPLYAPARSGELARSALDPGRALIHLGWKPWTAIEDGTSAVLQWFAKERNKQQQG